MNINLMWCWLAIVAALCVVMPFPQPDRAKWCHCGHVGLQAQIPDPAATAAAISGAAAEATRKAEAVAQEELERLHNRLAVSNSQVNLVITLSHSRALTRAYIVVAGCFCLHVYTCVPYLPACADRVCTLLPE
jgi:hypothetical protein